MHASMQRLGQNRLAWLAILATIALVASAILLRPAPAHADVVNTGDGLTLSLNPIATYGWVGPANSSFTVTSGIDPSLTFQSCHLVVASTQRATVFDEATTANDAACPVATLDVLGPVGNVENLVITLDIVYADPNNGGAQVVRDYSTIALIGAAPVVGGSTPSGSDVTITPVDSSGTTTAVITFSSVTSPGTTSLNVDPNPPAPTGFSFGSGTVYDISTTATFSGVITVCLEYDQADFVDPSGVRLYHYESNTWTDVTTAGYPAIVGGTTWQVCGVTTSLSPFAIGHPVYPFTGFFPPVDNGGTLNVMQAGAAVPVKFSLGADLGLGILAPGYPQSVRVACSATAPLDTVEQVVTDASGLSFTAGTNQYVYTWKTDKAWAGTCRQFTLRLLDGTDHTALFQFKS